MNQLATAKLTDVTNAFDDASAGGGTLAAAATRAGMRVVHVPAVDRNGLTPQGTKAALPATADFLEQLQKSEIGEEGDPFPSTDNNVYVIKVNGVTPPKLKPIDSVRTQAAAAWTANWETQRLAQMAGQLVREGNADKSLSGIAARMHVSVQSTGALKRNSASPALPSDLIHSLFDSPPGAVVSAPAPHGDGLLVARVTGVAEPPAPMQDPQFFRFARSVSDDGADDFVSTLAMAARARLGVTINQSQVDRITGG
jgi:peptidyl-prolyl cis-trans isomerase D